MAFSTVTPAARAARPSCDDLLSAVNLGQSREQVARDFSTTSARIQACAELAKQHDRQEARREQFEARRAERGLPMIE
ncbi:MAG: hypothetical protein ABI629_09100 [bacterium]